MTLLALLAALVPQAHAQACVCSRNVALPSGQVSRTGEVVVGIDYSIALSGDTSSWEGLSVTDRFGDSMAGMYMPPHLVQTWSLTANVGLPRSFSVSATLPYIDTHHLDPSEMPGDVDSSALADADITGKWSHLAKDSRSFYGASLGLTLPTGEVVADSPVRSGRGVVGAVAGVQAGRKLTPKVALIGALSGSIGFGADPTGYRVGPGGSLVTGVRWSPRENGRVNLGAYGLLRGQGTDWQDALEYQNTGFVAADLALGFGWTFWEKKLRSAALNARVQAPLWQVVGDPMYVENVAGNLGVSVVAF